MKKGEDYTGITVVYLCHDGQSNYLLAKRSVHCRDEHGTWDCGGGGLELGDTVENTLKKEITEEYCTDIVSSQFLGYRDVHREHDGKKTHWIALDFLVQVDPIKVKNGEPHKFDAVEWFTLDTLPTPLHSQLPHFLNLYKEKILSSKKVWFKRKTYGYGWVPVTWQGWLVIAVWLALVSLFACTIDERSSIREVMFTFILPIVLLTTTLIRICYKTGEKPLWQWGEKEDKN